MVLDSKGVRRLVSLLSLVLIADIPLASAMVLVPSLPQSVELGGTSLANIWNHALRQQKDEDGNLLRCSGPEPRTIISPDDFRMVNLVPMDGPHPLYSNKYADLRTEFLLDYMVVELVSPGDPALAEGDGIKAQNMNGKTITFKKDAGGQISIDGQNVLEAKELPDGTVLYKIPDFLFGHKERVDEALEVLRKETPRFGPMGRPLNLPLPPKPSQ